MSGILLSYVFVSYIGWQLTSRNTKSCNKIIWWVSATERILLCMTDSSMSRNADVADEIISKDAHFEMMDL